MPAQAAMLQQSCFAAQCQLRGGKHRSAGQLRRAAQRSRPALASALDVALGPSVDVLPPRRAALKDALLAALAPTSRGARASPAQAAAVDVAAKRLEARCPIANPVQAVPGRWELLYTTEKDVHAFCSLPGGVSSVSQDLAPDSSRVTNRIAWRLGFQLAAGAPASCSLPKRVSYRFDSLALTAGGLQLAAFRLGGRAGGPGGWSDTLYVDDDTRIARNSRGDLLIFRRAAA